MSEGFLGFGWVKMGGGGSKFGMAGAGVGGEGEGFEVGKGVMSRIEGG